MKSTEKQALKDTYVRTIALIIAIFVWTVSVILCSFAKAGFLSDKVILVAVWGSIGTGLTLLSCIVATINAKRSVANFKREQLAKDFEQTETLEIMQAVCSNYNAVYYLDMLKEEVKFIRIGNRIENGMPENFTEKHPFEWYIKAYGDRMIYEENRAEFMENVNPELIREKLKDRDVYVYNYIGDKNGEPNYFQMRAAKVNGSENHFVLGFADVNEELKESESRERMLREALENVENANGAKNEFLSKMSGDLRSPLNVIVSSAARIEARADKESLTAADARKIIIASDNLDTMINDVLDISAWREGNLFLENQLFAIKDALNEALALLSKRTANKGLKIECNLQAVHERIYGDAQKFIDMLRHILCNAIECSNDGGVINVTIIETQVLKGKAYFDIFVEDHGTTLEESVIESIFSDDVIENGAALGLSTTRIIAEMMSGKLVVTGKPEGGNAVKLYLSFEFED